MIKRVLLILVISLLVVACSVPAFALDGYNVLKSIGIFHDEIYTKTNHELITREELACITASIMDGSKKDADDTCFSDVDSSNKYSGYIKFLEQCGIISGTGGSLFNPNGYVTTDVANKMLLSAIGYGDICNEIGGYPNGYRTIAKALNLNKKVVASEGGYLSVSAMASMIQNLLETELPGIGIQTGRMDTTLTQKNTSVLGNVFGISVYNGKITRTEKGIAIFNVEDNVFNSNPEHAQLGQNLNLKVLDWIDSSFFELVPAVVYVNENKEIVHIEAQQNVEVAYKVIDSVNGDTNPTSKYSIGNINKITFINDNRKYDVSLHAELKYNNKATTTSVKLTGNTVRVIMKDEKVIYIETWNLRDGGIVTDINSEQITYISGKKQGMLLDNLHLCDDIITIVDGESAGYGFIRKDAVFDYYVDDSLAVFVVSNQKVVDTFNGAGSGNVELGMISYNTRDVLYYSRDGKCYFESNDEDYSFIFNMVAEAYLGPDGYVRYIKPLTGQNIENDKFYGIVSAVRNADFSTNTQVQVWKIADTVTREVYEITDKILWNDNISLQELDEYSANFEGKGIYVFETNPNGIIKTVSRPRRVRGFGENITSTSSEPLLFVDSTDNRVIHHAGVDFVSMFTDKNGEFSVKYTTASSLNQRSKTVDFFSLNGDLEVSIALIRGDMAERSTTGDGKRGILIGKKNIISDDGKEMTELTLLIAGGKEKCIISTDTAATLELYSLFSYGSASSYLDEDIVIRSDSAPFVLVPDCENWYVSNDNIGYHFAFVEDVSSDKIALSNDMVYSFNGRMDFLAEYDSSDNKEPFKNIDLQSITEGDYVYYYTRKNSSRYVAVNGIIVIR